MPADDPESVNDWILTLEEACARKPPDLQDLADQAVREYPREYSILYLAVLASLRAERPERCRRYLARIKKHYVTDRRDELLRAVGMAQDGAEQGALDLLRGFGLPGPREALRWFAGPPVLQSWMYGWLRRIYSPPNPAPKRATHVHSARPRRTPDRKEHPAAARAATPDAPTSDAPDLPRFEADIPFRVEITNAEAIPWDAPPATEDDGWFHLRTEFAHLGLLQGFDELLCLPLLHNVDTYWYQVETVRKVLKSFRGRVLLADEVGLGKTIEAGMVLKEYVLRGMAEKVLILTPASLVGQWQEEMATKFDIACATSYDPLLRSDPDAFWDQPRVIASLATARRQEHAQRLARQNYDLVIVDEAHHLKNRSTRNHQLVDALRKRFLLLLSATPVQNSLVELYNLLTLLKPGIFHTEKEFRAAHMTPGKPRVPAHRDRMHDLMRDVMVRNTRSLVDVHLPPRHAVTLRLAPDTEERDCYRALDALVQDVYREAPGHHRLALHHLLSAAGSSPAAAAAAIGRFDGGKDPRWKALHERYRALPAGVKEHALLDLLRKNPEEKTMVFVHHRETLQHLEAVLGKEGIPFARFDGSLSGPEKDAAIASFRDQVPVLLSTQSGGEGRNVQFSNTLINYDLPWNPMVIEQRIGRIHRIGQTRDVFIFNLVAEGTLENEILRILDEKINMFELVVGEIDAILGEMDEQMDFAGTVFSTWVEATGEDREAAFDALAGRVAGARRQYEAAKALDTELFGEEFET